MLSTEEGFQELRLLNPEFSERFTKSVKNIRTFFEPLQEEEVITDDYVTRALKDIIIQDGRISGDSLERDGTYLLMKRMLKADKVF